MHTVTSKYPIAGFQWRKRYTGLRQIAMKIYSSAWVAAKEHRLCPNSSSGRLDGFSRDFRGPNLISVHWWLVCDLYRPSSDSSSGSQAPQQFTARSSWRCRESVA